MLETIQQAIKPHDKYQIEIKLDYELFKARQTRYRISTYIFVPQSLGISKESYSKADFYRDVQNYIRLKTPTFILREFTDNSTSPLLHLEKIVSENWSSDPDNKERLVVHFKLLSAMLKSSIREHFNLIQRRIAEAGPSTKIHLVIHNLVEEFLVETQKITDRYRSCYAAFNLPNVDERVFGAYKFTDESISLLIEESAIEMFQIVQVYLKKSDKVGFKHLLSERVKSEIKHRKAHGYRSILKLGDENEEYTFRTSVLKKYASSVLYLSTAVRREGRELEHFLLAIAAGISMVFATIVAFYFQRQYGNFTLPFFAALVVGYMFKDRIKELGRAFFTNYLQNALYDRRIIIRTQDGKHKLGILKEKVSFVQEKDVPASVWRDRGRDPFTELDNDGQGENIICYSKDIVLYTNVFQRIFADFPDISGINDIIRYDIGAYLRKMDDPVQHRYYLENDQLCAVPSHKVYHLNLVSRYRSLHPEKAKMNKRIRLVLNREGIKRIEHIS
jgi:hypothetical protein